ncbi:hypothetical protein Pmani_013003 [Petrolisthes manimaculis]|uniref:Uncharacterized protein n=1 Tax=Petrolisthes manimaculis TaxID=1843537 RepID=A0AAE1PVU7_9EUCA|nr:hypothetical protein Pmani_013003 [Petrolisthes manimaculis]
MSSTPWTGTVASSNFMKPVSDRGQGKQESTEPENIAPSLLSPRAFTTSSSFPSVVCHRGVMLWSRFPSTFLCGVAQLLSDTTSRCSVRSLQHQTLFQPLVGLSDSSEVLVVPCITADHKSQPLDIVYLLVVPPGTLLSTCGIISALVVSPDKTDQSLTSQRP